MTKLTRKPPRRRPAANDGASPIPAAKSRLEAAGIMIDATDVRCWRIADHWLFWPATTFWRAEDRSRQGYDVRSLIAAVKASRGTSSPSS